MVKMKALDTFHATNVRADNLVEGDVFDISESDAKILEDRGLAKRYSGGTEAVNTVVENGEPNKQVAAIKDAEDNVKVDLNAGAKALVVNSNKMAAAPENKSVAPKGKK